MYGFPKEKSDTKRDLGIRRLGVYKHGRDLSWTFYLQRRLKFRELIFEWSELPQDLCFGQKRKVLRVAGKREGQRIQTNQQLLMIE